ncbi:MAG: Crp/Fnr family transcriptional regulator [Cyclobacteriaceae bacterium]
MNYEAQIQKALSHLSEDLVAEIIKEGTVQEIPFDTEILREGQYVNVIPVVLQGLVKVYTRHESRELLLYYIEPNQSCVMSFSVALKNAPSRVLAKTEETSVILLLPSDKVAQWTQQYADLNNLFFDQYNQRYIELLDTIHHLLFDKMDVRLMSYLNNKIGKTNEQFIRMSHREIANELGTAREVVSRIMKKLEFEGKLEQLPQGIRLIEV